MEQKMDKPGSASDEQMPQTLVRILHDAFKHGASDIHISTGCLPRYRINGQLHIVSEKVLPVTLQQDINKWCQALDITQKNNDSEFLLELQNIARFRGSFFRQQNGAAMVLRQLPLSPPDFASINAPPVFAQLLHNQQGLILLTGATGSGKSTTLAAMVNYVNQQAAKHIICLEDPIEYIHLSQQSLIHQRQKQRDFKDYAKALRHALRQDPDIILIGEMRDEETIQMALRAAETGHLVLSTLHTQSAAKAINRIIGSFANARQSLIRAQLSQCLKASIWQQLVCVEKHEKSRRQAAWEILLNNHAVANLIRQNKTEQLESVQQCHRHEGMQTMAQALQEIHSE